MRPDNKAGQKVALVALVFIGILTLGLGFYKVQNQIAGPFQAQISRATDSQLEKFFEKQAQFDETEAQKNRDTDSDGLSDYDELVIHKTSPYLKDTDSDNYDDKKEVSTGNDPNCASGKVCFTASPSVVRGGSVIPAETGIQTGKISALEADLKKLESLTPAQVRELLKQQGFKEDELKDVDDSTLVNLYRESLGKAIELEKQKDTTSPAPQQGALPGIQSSAQTQAQLQTELANLSKPQIIQMLTETGQLSSDQVAQLQQIDETQLRVIFLQALQQAQANYDAKRP